MNEFQNNQINISLLPKYDEVNFSTMHPNYWKVIIINIVIYFSLLLFIIIGMYFSAVETQPFLSLILLAFVVILSAFTFLNNISFKKRGFAFRDHDVLYKSGILSTTTTIIPYNRIQHIELNERYISKIFGLSELVLFTAGESSSDISISGIQKDEAESIKQFLTEKLNQNLK